MKIRFRNIMILLVLFVGGSSCDSFLDVQPKGEVLEGDLLKDAKGFENALYGVYAKMGTAGLYGQNLSYYALDLMAQYYTSANNEEAEPLIQYDYKSTKVEDRFYNIWCEMYSNIAYANNVLEHLEHFSPSDMQFYNIYKGVALGLRGFMHFDLLRIFSEQITENEGADGIPYSTRFSLFAPDVLKAKDVYKRIISDLKSAEQLLDDEELYASASSNANFLKDQNIHFNLQAVQATLARVYLTEGVLDSALYYAQRVMQSSGLSLLDYTEIAGDMAGKLSSKETVFGIYSKSFADPVIKILHNSQTAYSLEMRYNIQQLYQVDGTGNDYRWSAWYTYNDVAKDWKLDKLTDSYVLNNNEYSRPAGQIRGINMIRLSEMYYIAAECALKLGHYDQALDYFNELLESRGLVALDERTPAETLTIDKITDDRYKEFVGEGQSFYHMKRLNLDILNVEGKIIPADKKVYVVDIPSQEFEFRR